MSSPPTPDFESNFNPTFPFGGPVETGEENILRCANCRASRTQCTRTGDGQTSCSRCINRGLECSIARRNITSTSDFLDSAKPRLDSQQHPETPQHGEATTSRSSHLPSPADLGERRFKNLPTRAGGKARSGTTPQYEINMPSQLPSTPRHTPRYPNKDTFAVPRVPAPRQDSAPSLSTDILQNYIKMLNHPRTADAVAPVSPAMNQDLTKLFDMLQGVTNSPNPPNPASHSTPYMDANDYRSIEELITSPDFTSPLFEDTPILSDASPFKPSSSSASHTSSGGIPLVGLSPIATNPNQAYGTPDSLQLQSGGLEFENLDSLLTISGSPTSPAADTRDLFSSTTLPLFPAARSVPPPQDVQSHGPSATSRKAIPAGFEERRARIVTQRRQGPRAEQLLSEDATLNAAVEGKRRANTVAGRRSRQRKLEYVWTLEQQLEERTREMELWKERAIAAEGIARAADSRDTHPRHYKSLAFLSLHSDPAAVYLAKGSVADIWSIANKASTDELNLPSIYVSKALRVSVRDFDEPSGANAESPQTQMSKYSSGECAWPRFVKAYRDRISRWARVAHANVVRIYDCDPHSLNLRVEYCPAGSVREYIKAQPSGMVSKHDIVRLYYVNKVLKGLNYLHSQDPPIVHGSLNTGKIFVNEKHEIKIGEFGLTALCYQAAPDLPSVTFTGFSRWMSPELLIVDPEEEEIVEPTTKSDIWTLACTVHEIITEKLPYSKYTHDIRIQRAILNGELPGNPILLSLIANDTDIQTIWKLCWSQHPSDRPSIDTILWLTHDWWESGSNRLVARSPPERGKLLGVRQGGQEEPSSSRRRPEDGSESMFRDILSQEFVNFEELASTSSFLPALHAACPILQRIWTIIDRVSLNKERHKVLRTRCVHIFLTTRDNARGMDESVLNLIVKTFRTTITGIQSSLSNWATSGILEDFSKKDAVDMEIERSMGQLDTCWQNLQIAAQLELSGGTGKHEQTPMEI